MLRIFILILCSFVLFSSCSTTQNPNDPNDVIIGTMNAKINGVPWSVPNAILVSPLTANKIEGKTTIIGVALNGTSIMLVIDSAKVGTYMLPQIPTGVTSGQYIIPQDTVYSSSIAGLWGSPGTITISEITTVNIKGTFSFKAFLTNDPLSRDSVMVSEGVFNARFTN
jgi:hypothetical protein